VGSLFTILLVPRRITGWTGSSLAPSQARRPKLIAAYRRLSAHLTLRRDVAPPRPSVQPAGAIGPGRPIRLACLTRSDTESAAAGRVDCALVPGLERDDLHAGYAMLDDDAPFARRAHPLLRTGRKGSLQLHFVAFGIGHFSSSCGRVRVRIGIVAAMRLRGVYASASGVTLAPCRKAFYPVRPTLSRSPFEPYRARWAGAKFSTTHGSPWIARRQSTIGSPQDRAVAGRIDRIADHGHP